MNLVLCISNAYIVISITLLTLAYSLIPIKC